MNNLGLVSISFRQHTVEEIINHCTKAGLTQIEWGSDIHVPQADPENAARVAALTKAAGMEVASYGSYYYLTKHENHIELFRQYLEAAKALGANIIRIWAGTKGSAVADEAYRAQCVAEAQEISDMAKEYGITVAFEYHPGTLTDDCDSAMDLLKAIDRENCKIYWQPNFNKTLEENLRALSLVLPYVSIIHTFYWAPGVRLPMADGGGVWGPYMNKVKESGKTVKFLLEFVENDDITLLKREADALLAHAKAVDCYIEK